MTDITVPLPDHDTLDEHDQMELMTFASKVENEGLGYTLWQYKPEFHHAGLASLVDQTSAGYDALNEWLERQDDAITEFWDRDDAEALHNAHIDAKRAERRVQDATS